ncbi:endonuclease/exonuclease/phosphatase family protein [Nitrosomonas communis]|uniref:Exonuclease III n=1 Tax=Nitrosomonas communis TaxID=44574 RepID=A0A1I4RHL6_9PROT|nr:Exonuclease III [Nitrosomonas communis]
MRLISWNLNSRQRNLENQVAALVALKPDVVALQEVTPTTVFALRTMLANAGLRHVADSFSLAGSRSELTGRRRYGQLTASRCQLISEPPGRFTVPWPERVLSVTLMTLAGHVEIHNTHVPPGSSNKWVKIDHLDGLYAGLACPEERPRILCGDFNTPREELSTGEVVTWGQRPGLNGWRIARTIHGRAGSDWDRGERQVLTGLAAWGLPDVYRQLHGYDRVEASWVFRGMFQLGRRFDHVFASPSLRAEQCRYIHEFRERGLSDHSAIEAVFRWPTCAT